MALPCHEHFNTINWHVGMSAAASMKSDSGTIYAGFDRDVDPLKSTVGNVPTDHQKPYMKAVMRLVASANISVSSFKPQAIVNSMPSRG